MLSAALWGGSYSMEDLVEIILDAGNRTGKTVLIAILHIYFAYYKIGVKYGAGYDDFKYRTFDISPQSRQAKECLKYIEDILEGRLTWMVNDKRFSNSPTLKLKNFYEGKNENIGELRYSNRSITYAFSTGEDKGAGFQGLPAGFISYDECVLSHHLEDELDSNVYPRLGDYGKLMMLVSTPNEEGKSQQYFYHLIAQSKNRENNYLVAHGSYLENIFISEEKRKSHAATLQERDPVMARQSLFGEFVSTGGNMFETQVIDQLWDRSMSRHIDPVEDHEYLMTIDWGVADKGDETVIYVIDVTPLLSGFPGLLVHHYAKQGGDPYELMAVARNIWLDYHVGRNGTLLMDTSAMGGKMFKKMMRDMKPEEFEANGEGGKIKADALMDTQLVLTKNRKKRVEVDGTVYEDNPHYGWLRMPYLPKLASQLATYQKDDAKLKQDWVSALYMACWHIWRKYGDKVTNKKVFKYSPFRVRGPEVIRPRNF